MSSGYDLDGLLNAAKANISNIKPSEWAEKHRVLAPDISAIPGKFSYNNSPYSREIVDCLSPDHPAKVVAIMKGAQIGFSTGVIESGIGWIMSQQPGNTLFLIGHDDLVGDAMQKVDRMIDACGIRHLIKSNLQKTNNRKSGDTDKIKEFPNGYLKIGTANHKVLRNISMQYGFIDDFEGMKGSTKQSGSTTAMIEQRFAAFAKKMKLFYISTPELKQGSNIEPVYLLGDQRRYYIPCPCCGEFITLEWSIDIKDSDEKAGIYYRLDDNNKLIDSSVGYICQSCGGFFDDRHKQDLIIAGQWKPTATPSREGYYSYQISSLYAPTFMYGWKDYVYKFLEACPPGSAKNESLYKTFMNLCLGLTYEEISKEIEANTIQRNIRDYEIGMLPEKLSTADGNGPIVLITCAADLNGTINDARLDYEIVAWSETGASYSVVHGSIGTFVPREGSKKIKVDREHWTYEHNQAKSVWPEFEKIISQTFKTDTGRSMKILLSGVDTGHYTIQAYGFVDKTNNMAVGIKGKDADKYIRFGVDLPSFKPARERNKLYLVEVNQVKDRLSERIDLKWDKHNDEQQPPGFMNFPIPSNGKYLYTNYFSHYEAEVRDVKRDGENVSACWKKKTSVVQNHFFDVAVYNMTIKDIVTEMICKEFKVQGKPTWKDYVDIVLASIRTK